MNIIESNYILNRLKQPSELLDLCLFDPSAEELEMLDDQSPQTWEFYEYDDKIKGTNEETDKWTYNYGEPFARFNGKQVCPSFIGAMSLPYVFHVEIRFKDFHFTDAERLAMVRDFMDDLNIEVLERHDDIRLHRSEYDCGPELDDEPMTEEEEIRDAFIIRSEQWNEFRRPDKHPRLHILISISPPYFARLQMEIFERLRSLETVHNCKFKQVIVKRITNRAELFCEILGVHKDHFYRELTFY